MGRPQAHDIIFILSKYGPNPHNKAMVKFKSCGLDLESTRADAKCSGQHYYLRVGAASDFFFFISRYSAASGRFAPTT